MALQGLGSAFSSGAFGLTNAGQVASGQASYTPTGGITGKTSTGQTVTLGGTPAPVKITGSASSGGGGGGSTYVPPTINVPNLATTTSPVTSPTIKADSLTSPYANVQMPTYNPTTGQEAFIQSNLASITPPTKLSPTEQAIADLQTKNEGLQSQMGNQYADYQNMQNQYGVTQNINRLNDVYAQILKANQDFTATNAQLAGQAIPSPIILKQQEVNRSAAAANIGALSAYAQALQGNIQLAQQTISQAIDMKYAPIKNQIQYNNDAISQNYNLLTREDKKIADKQKFQNDLALTEINNLADFKKTVASKIIDTNPALLSGIMGANSMEEVAKLTGTALNTSNTGPSTETMAYAQQYAATGKIPTGLPKGTFGTIAQIAKEMPKSEGQILDRATGVAPDTLGAAGDAYAALYSAVKLSEQLKELDNKRWGGIVAGTIGKIWGSEDQSKYVDLRNQIVDLLSRARSGAALTPSEEERYSGMLPGRFSNPLMIGTDSQVRIDNFISTLTSDLINKTNTKGWVVNGLTPIKLGNTTYKVGDVIESNGMRGRVNPDGTVTII